MDYEIFLDMDGVIADFKGTFEERHRIDADEYYDEHGPIEFWLKAWEDPQFFLNINPFWYTYQLTSLCSGVADGRLKFLTAPTITNEDACRSQKREWIKRVFSEYFPVFIEKRKHIYAKPHRILIDDKKENIDKWIAAGGIGHLFVTYEECVDFLNKLYAENRANEKK